MPRPTVMLLAMACLTLSACSLFREPLPDASCRNDRDCFRSQGEVCNQELHRCEPAIDAAPPVDAAMRPDAAPPVDAPPAADGAPAGDGGVDAGSAGA